MYLMKLIKKLDLDIILLLQCNSKRRSDNNPVKLTKLLSRFLHAQKYVPVPTRFARGRFAAYRDVLFHEENKDFGLGFFKLR